MNVLIVGQIAFIRLYSKEVKNLSKEYDYEKAIQAELIYERQLRNALHDLKTLRRVEGELDAIEAELEKGIRQKILDVGYIYEKTEAVKKSIEYIERMVLKSS